MTSAVKTMDCSYVYGLIAYGVLFFGAMIVGYTGLIHKYVKEQKNLELLMIFALLAAGLTEPFLFNTSFKNISFLFMGAYLFEKGKAETDRLMIRFHGKALEDISVPVAGIDWQEAGYRMKEAVGKKKKYLAAISLMAGLACTILYIANVPVYRGVIVPRVHCTDIEKGTSVYLTDEESEEYKGYLIWDYKDEKTPMECFEGNILSVEKVRGGISRGMLGYALCYCLMSVGMFIAYGKTKVRNEK